MQNKIIVFPEPPPNDKAQLARSNLPVSLTSLIDREQEMQILHGLLLRPDVRLLTLTGTPGVGKTRLALEVVRDLTYDFADGVHMVSLAPLSDPAFVIPTIARRLELTASGPESLLDQLKISQRDKQQLLLLDNFEHVISTALLLTELLEACPHLKLLVTSREVLHLRGEHQFTVLPLALPDPRRLPDDQSLAQVPAVKLFLQRIQATRPEFHLTSTNAVVIAEICLRLDGLPLAIELAAARVKLLPPRVLLERLEKHRLGLLTAGARDMPEQQQTLRSTLQWSYNLLNLSEQRLFRRLSVFEGGCTLETLEAICTTLDGAHAGVLEGMASLLDKSLLQQIEQAGDEPRFVMLETIREYGLERLIASGEAAATQQAQAAYYLVLAERAEPELVSAQQAAWLERLEQEYDNLRAIFRWSLEPVEGSKVSSRVEIALRIGKALAEFWQLHGHYSEGRSFLEQALEASEGVVASVRAKALSVAALLVNIQGDTERSESLVEESLTFYREIEDKEGIALALYQLGHVAWSRGKLVEADSLIQESLALSRELSDTNSVAYSLSNLAGLANLRGEYARGSALFEESLALFKKLGNKKGIALSLLQLAELQLASGNDESKARQLLEEGLVLYREVGGKDALASSSYFSGRVALNQGDHFKAHTLLEESLVIYKELGDRQHIVRSLLGLAKVEASQGNYTKAQALYEESLRLVKVDQRLNIASSLEGLAHIAVAQGEFAWAARLCGAAEVLRETMKTPLPPIERADYDQAVATVRAQLGEKVFAAAWAQGRVMPLEQLLTAPAHSVLAAPIAATQPPATKAPSSPVSPGGLTAREVEVLCLLAQGLTSAQMAERLVISVVTVNSHVRSIYNKLDVSSRAAATRYAIEHHLA